MHRPVDNPDAVRMLIAQAYVAGQSSKPDWSWRSFRYGVAAGLLMAALLIVV
jgi:hypothetical protein